MALATAPPRLVDVEHAGSDGTDRGAGSQTLHDPSHEKRVDAVGVDEDGQGQDLTGDAREQHGAPPDVIGEPSDR